jgi:phosphoglycerol transferase MdoB-like AlkP superfamily enzyme
MLAASCPHIDYGKSIHVFGNIHFFVRFIYKSINHPLLYGLGSLSHFLEDVNNFLLVKCFEHFALRYVKDSIVWYGYKECGLLILAGTCRV